MSEVVTGVLKLTFGLIANKLRAHGAEKLKDGDLTAQSFRGLIVGKLDAINCKLDAISRKDLRASISSLEQGIHRLNMSFGKTPECGNPSTSELISKDGKQPGNTATCAGAIASSSETKPAEQSVSVEDAVGLASAIVKLELVSPERFEWAKESFKDAGKEAKDAFHNSALSINERILATKVRIASGILEKIDDLELAAKDCLHYLRELHDIPAIQEIVSVHLSFGLGEILKSLFKTESRDEIVMTVLMINLILADFISKFTKQRMPVFEWPMVQCGKRVIHLVHFTREYLSMHWDRMKIRPPWEMVVLKEGVFTHEKSCNALTKKGDLLCFTESTHGLQKLDKTTGELQPYCLSSLDNTIEHPQLDKVIDLAVDEDDTVYVLSGNTEVGHYTLSVYSADGRKARHCALKFLQGLEHCNAVITATNDKNIVDIATIRTVFLCNSNGELISSFDLPHPSITKLISVSVSRMNEIILLTKNSPVFSNKLYVYSQDGHLRRSVKFSPSHQVGDNSYNSLCYNQVTNNIIGHIRGDGIQCKYMILIQYLSCQKAELQRSYVLFAPGDGNFSPEDDSSLLHLVCHTNGTLALVGRKCVFFLTRP